ncbi:hypothetical protein M407DRAFT_215494 [Tulasnella calospora MUT 4182]|uniref:F-box domain-containing protein n=1 Tax=Tulasnella calospora MUT 4182 TaxID=1051891 RepID=A0A0C3Q377_9AGAM|nr:hypothetical protein M407DRAFT_215494 [Tulasnella calospora MUT 4182]
MSLGLETAALEIDRTATTFTEIANRLRLCPNEILQSTILAQAASIEDAISLARLSIIRLRRLSNQLCPIMRLPSEILADAIGPLLTQEDYPKALIRLSHTSHHIREILLSSPWVWAGARIKSSWHPNLVTAMLEQTGRTLLQVSCDFAVSQSMLGSEKIASCIQRWRSAHLRVPSLPEFPTSLTQLRSLAAPALEELVVSVPHRPLPTIVPELFSGVAPQLRSIEFHNFSIYHDSPLWLNLHSLHLNIQHLWAVLSPHQLFSILTASPELQILRLCDRMVGLGRIQEPDPYPVIELPHLSTMELAVVPYMLEALLNTIKGPVVKQLEITTTFIDESPQLPRKVLGSFFKSAAQVLATLANEDEPPTARITVESSSLHFCVRRGDSIVSCQLNCTDSDSLAPLFREAAEQCGTRLPVLVDFAWITFSEGGRGFREILSCRNLWVRCIALNRTFQSPNLFSFLSTPTADPGGQLEWPCPQLETIGGDIEPSSVTVHNMLRRRCSRSCSGHEPETEVPFCKQPPPLRSVFLREFKEEDMRHLRRVIGGTKILDWNTVASNIRKDTQSNWPEAMKPIGSYWS